MKKKSQRLTRKEFIMRLLMIFLFTAGALTACYPFYTDALNAFIAQQQLARFQEKSRQNSKEELEHLRQEMEKKNEDLLKENTQIGNDPFNKEAIEAESPADSQQYLIGVLTIPKLEIQIAVYDHTSDVLLELGAVLLDGTSFPIGGTSTHATISAHTGLPNNKYFTDLHTLQEGDQFYLAVLDKKLAYKVRSMEVIEPTEIEALRIIEGEDIVTLMTCTPYMVNSHRLLVHGYRIPYTKTMDEEIAKVENTVQQKLWLILGILGLGLLLLLFFIIRLIKKHRKK